MYHFPAQTLPKPPYGAPCNNCGACCMAGPCQPFMEAFGSQDQFLPCPALEQESGRFLCGMMQNPETYYGGKIPPKKVALLRRYFAILVGAGRGCLAALNAEELRAKGRDSDKMSSQLELGRIKSEANHLARKLGNYLPFRTA